MGKKKLSFKEIMTNYGVIIIMVCLIVFTGITRPNFITTNNLTNILATMSFRLVIALGIAGCIITAGCDLSAGRMIGFGGCIAGTLLQKMDYSAKFYPGMKPLNIWLALLIVMLICAAFGLVTGFFIAYLNVAIHFHNGCDGNRLWYLHLYKCNSSGGYVSEYTGTCYR